MDKFQKTYDLEERTAKFGEAIIDFCKKLKQDAISRVLINQVIRSATSIGANYMEANGASSRKDFRNKIFICKKESQETKHWLRMIKRCFTESDIEINKLFQEAQELCFIFGKIAFTLNEKIKI